MKLLTLYEKLEKLVQRLPETLQQPILREITPIKTLFLLQRPPRLALLGDRTASKAELMNAVFGEEVVQPGDEMLHDGTWQQLSHAGRGTLRLLDARRPVSLALAETALVAEAPDVYLLAHGAAGNAEFEPDLAHATELIKFADSRHESRARVIAVQFRGDEAALDALHRAAHASPALATRLAATLHFRGPGTETHRLVELIAAELPVEARLEAARLSGNRELQRELARVVVKSATAICAAVGTQPIPLADFPILTSLQASMVAAIMHISGREINKRLAGEFIGAIGANIGAALVLREGARAFLKFVPVWGDFVSGAIAAGGTYAIGRAAVAYFIEGASLKDARGLFRKRPRPPALVNS